jgi:leucyl/phenylalanyl-tRNA---protein transferase
VQPENYQTESDAEPSTTTGAAESGPRERAAEGLRERLGLPRDLTWESALGKLHQTGGKLRELRDKGFVRVQRVLGNASTRLPPTPLGALCGVADTFPLTAENVLLGYAQGLFAMDIDGKVRWHCPPERFIVYLNELRISSNMRRELKRASYTTTFDRAPREVLDACAAERAEGTTWLSERFKKIYMELFELGAMHTVEAWKDGALVGGSFGVSIGRIWTSESMFHRAPHAGKVQFAAAAAHLIERGFEVVDGQMYSEHFARFGAKDVPIAEYRAVLARGLANPARFHPEGALPVSEPASGTKAVRKNGAPPKPSAKAEKDGGN